VEEEETERWPKRPWMDRKERHDTLNDPSTW
jgi:hypothetical protein